MGVEVVAHSISSQHDNVADSYFGRTSTKCLAKSCQMFYTFYEFQEQTTVFMTLSLSSS